MKGIVKNFTMFLLGCLLLTGVAIGQTTTIDFETENAGYTPSTTFGSGNIDTFNRVNTAINGNSTYHWVAEDISGNPYIDLTQIDISTYSSFTFSVDLSYANEVQWDSTDELLITYSTDGGSTYSNLMWVQHIPNDDYNEKAALDLDFDGNGDVGQELSATTFTTFTTGSIDVSSSTLDIKFQFNNLTSNGEGIFIDNIVITGTVSGAPTAIISADPVLTESNLNGADVNITLSNETFADEILSSDNFTLNNAPSGVTINGVSYVSTTTATITLAFTGADFDEDSTNFNITIAGAELTGTSDLTSNNLTISYVTEEPANHASSFTGAVISDIMAKVTWNDNQDIGDPTTGFLLEIYPSGSGASSFTPVDGNDNPSNTNSVFVWVGTSVGQHTFSGLTAETQYTARIWPYSGSGSSIDYKTDGTVPSVTESTDAAHTTIGSETFIADLGVMTAVSVAGTNTWGYSSGVAQANGYNGSNPEEDWLLSPEINLDNFSNDVLYFETAYNYGTQDANNYLKLYYTTSYSTPAASSWTEVTFQTPTSTSTTTSSGLIDISGISGTAVVFGYKYYSTDNPSRWDVDNIYITGIALVAASAPEVSTGSAGSVTHNSATLNGWVDANLADATVTFEYGEDTSYGSTLTADQSPVTGDGQVDVSANLTGLEPETTYHFRVKAVNSEGTTYGDDGTFTTTITPVISPVFISEMCDPGNSYATNRYIEIYNAGSSSVDLTDWKVVAIINDGSTEAFTWNLSGSIASGDALVCGDDGNTLITCDFAEANWSSSNTSWNGKIGDGAKLYDGTTLIDDAGSHGNFENKTTQRNSAVVEPVTIFSGTEWTSTATTNYENATPGSHTCDEPGDPPLPITLAAFTATAKNGAVELAWETASETNNARFVIYRNDEAIALVEGAGTTTEPHSYTYTDDAVIPGVTYTYVLADVDYANKETKYEANAVTVTVDNGLVEADFVVGAAYPNPFNPATIVPIELSGNAAVKASLYDLTGREVKALINANYTAGTHELRIDGSGLTTGIYLLHVAIDNVANIQKIALMK